MSTSIEYRPVYKQKKNKQAKKDGTRSIAHYTLRIVHTKGNRVLLQAITHHL